MERDSAVGRALDRSGARSIDPCLFDRQYSGIGVSDGRLGSEREANIPFWGQQVSDQCRLVLSLVSKRRRRARVYEFEKEYIP